MKLKKIAVPESALVVEGFTDYCPGFKTKEEMVAYYMQMNDRNLVLTLPYVKVSGRNHFDRTHK